MLCFSTAADDWSCFRIQLSSQDSLSLRRSILHHLMSMHLAWGLKRAHLRSNLALLR